MQTSYGHTQRFTRFYLQDFFSLVLFQFVQRVCVFSVRAEGRSHARTIADPERENKMEIG